MQSMPPRISTSVPYNQNIPQSSMEYNKTRDMSMNMSQTYSETTVPMSKNMALSPNVVMQNKQPQSTNPMQGNIQPNYQPNPQNLALANTPNVSNQKISNNFIHNNPNYYERQPAQNYVASNMYPEEMNASYINQNMNNNYMGNQNMQGQYMRQQQLPQAQQNFPIQAQNQSYYPQQMSQNNYNQISQTTASAGYTGGTGFASNNGNKMMGSLPQHQALQMANMSNEERRLLLEKLKSMNNWKNESTVHQQASN